MKALGPSSHSRQGETHGSAKLTEVKVRQLRTWLDEGTYNMHQIAAKHRVAAPTIWNAAYGITWSHVPGALKIKLRARHVPVGSSHRGQTTVFLSARARKHIDKTKRADESTRHAVDRLVAQWKKDKPLPKATRYLPGRVEGGKLVWISVDAMTFLAKQKVHRNDSAGKVFDRYLFRR